MMEQLLYDVKILPTVMILTTGLFPVVTVLTSVLSIGKNDGKITTVQYYDSHSRNLAGTVP